MMILNMQLIRLLNIKIYCIFEKFALSDDMISLKLLFKFLFLNCSNEESIHIQNKDILRRLIQAKDQLSRKLRKNEVNKTKIAAIKIFANFFILTCYAGIFYVIIMVVNEWSPNILKNNNCKNTNFGSIDDIQDFTVLHYFYLKGLVLFYPPEYSQFRLA